MTSDEKKFDVPVHRALEKFSEVRMSFLLANRQTVENQGVSLGKNDLFQLIANSLDQLLVVVGRESKCFLLLSFTFLLLTLVNHVGLHARSHRLAKRDRIFSERFQRNQRVRRFFLEFFSEVKVLVEAEEPTAMNDEFESECGRLRTREESRR